MRYLVLAVLLCGCGSLAGGPAVGPVEDGSMHDAGSDAPGSADVVTDPAAVPAVRPDAAAGPDAGEPCDISGVERCSGVQIQACEASKFWRTVATCAFVCADGVCTGICAPGAQQCVNGTSRTCNDAGVWLAGGLACRVGGDAAPPTDATDGPSATIDATRDANAAGGDACVNPFFPSEPCEIGCTPGTLRCSGDQPQICDATGSWVSNGVPCPWGCATPGICLDCPDGAIQCAYTTTQVCVASTWVDLPGDTRCRDAAAAVGGMDGARDAAECQPGAMGCDGNRLKECDVFGHWVDGVACQSGCTGPGICVDCFFGACLDAGSD